MVAEKSIWRRSHRNLSYFLCPRYPVLPVKVAGASVLAMLGVSNFGGEAQSEIEIES